MLTNREARDHLVFDLLGTADWRRRMATDNPTDARNIKAAETLEKLADEMKSANETIIDAYASLWGDYTHAEVHRELLRSIGVSWHPKTADQIVKQFIALRSIG